MRWILFPGCVLTAVLALGLVASGQQPREQGDAQPPRQERQRDGGDAGQRRGPRPLDDAGPMPKGSVRKGKSDDRGPGPDGLRPMPRAGEGAMPGGAMPGRGFGGFGGEMSGGYGGFGGGFGGMGGFGRGGYGEPAPDDPEMRELMKQDADLERDTMETAAQVRRASGAERDQLKVHLGEIVTKHFEVRQKRRGVQLQRMEEELKRLRDAISQRNEAREAIMRNRMAELIGEPKNLEF